jgi:hypothetical protein
VDEERLERDVAAVPFRLRESAVDEVEAGAFQPVRVIGESGDEVATGQQARPRRKRASGSSPLSATARSSSCQRPRVLAAELKRAAEIRQASK